MLRKFTQLMSIGLIFSLFLFLMVACSDDDDVSEQSVEAPPPQEEPAPAPQEPPPPPARQTPPPEDNPDQVASIDNTCILWKPVSEGDHKLVVLLPANYGTPELFIQDKDGNILDKGRYFGRTNGNRPTYRFSKSGGQYPNPCYLEVGGELYKVNNPRLRHSC